MLRNIINGLKAYGGTFKLLSDLSLWKYFGIPIAISFVTAAGIGFAAWGLSDNIGAFISKIWVWEWGAETFRTISDWIGGLTVVALGLILYKHTVMALSAPFMSPVSEKIELHLYGEHAHTHRNTSFWAQLRRGIQVNMRNLLVELLLTIPILILGFIPILGLISSPLLFLVQSYYAGFGNMDYTLERHFGYKDSVRFVRSYRGVAVGNGIVFMLMLLIPIFGIIMVLPLSVTASSTETLKLLQRTGKLQAAENQIQ